MEEPIVSRELFGGAVALSIPTRMIDISDFRPVPDNQEVFTDANLDQSLIVEFVEHHAIDNDEAGEFYFHDLSTAMDAVQQQITSLTTLRSDAVPHLPEGTYIALVEGTVAVSKGRQGAEALNKVQVILMVVRLPQHATDMLLTFNTPIFISEQSAAAEQAGAGYKDAHLSAPQLFRRMAATLNVVDWNIFGDPVETNVPEL